MATAPEVTLSLNYKNANPITLEAFTKSLEGLEKDYKDHTQNHNTALYIKKVETGSIIITLSELLGATATLFETISTLIEYAKHLKTTLQALKEGIAPPNATIKQIKHAKQLIQPIAKDNGAQMNITLNDTQNSTLIINFNSQEAKAMSYTADKIIEQLEQPKAQHYTNKLLHWHQIKDSPEGDKAIIESISPKPIKTRFQHPHIKQKLLTENDNPFTHDYIVDVQVETIENEPKLYIITNIREKL